MEKDEKKPVNSKKAQKKLEKKLEKEILWIVGFFAFLVVLFFVSSYVIRSMNEFEYKGLVFTIEKFDKLVVYHYYYYFQNQNGQLTRYNLYLRTDPRTNNISVSGDPIIFDKKTVYVTLKVGGLDECSETTRSVGDLGVFLAGNDFKVSSGNMEASQAIINNQTYITCEKYPARETIQILRAGDTSIVTAGNCTTISIGPSCNIDLAVEKFKVEAVVDAKSVNMTVK